MNVHDAMLYNVLTSAAQTANSEEDYDVLFSLLDPDPDPEEMGHVFEKALGYNPITFYQESLIREILNKAEELLIEYPLAVRMLQDDSEGIVNVSLRNLFRDQAQNAYYEISPLIEEHLRNTREIPPIEIKRLMDTLKTSFGGYRHESSSSEFEEMYDEEADDDEDESDESSYDLADDFDDD